jgi:hypothetical protein
MRRTFYFVIIGVLPLYSFAMPAHAAMFTVTNTKDSGPGSLRQALVDAKDGDTIAFAVTGTIVLTSEGLVIDKDGRQPKICGRLGAGGSLNVSDSCFIGNIFGATSSGGIGVFINSAG